LQSVENVWGCGNSEESEDKWAEWSRECYGFMIYVLGINTYYIIAQWVSKLSCDCVALILL